MELDSITAAVREEIVAASATIRTACLDIDAIEHLTDVPGNFLYRLSLSSPVHFNPDQTITFQTRYPKDTIQALIVRSDDQGLVVECQKPLPTDAKLLSFSFDPTFILRALENFVVELAPSAGPISRLLLSKTIPVPRPTPQRANPGLNADQALAVEEMHATPLHLLWGPPGTGKTTTVGAAVARWLRQKKRVLLVSTSNAAVDVAMRAVLKNLQHAEKQYVLRLGTSLDPLVKAVTLGGKMSARDSAFSVATTKAQDTLREIRKQVQNRNLSHDRLHELFAEAQPYEAQIREFNERAAQTAPQLTSCALVTGCTFAKMVLDANLRVNPFDVVVVDEASMVSLLYALAASFLATHHLIYAGDPKQLPPIVQSDRQHAAKWFGQNIYEWLGAVIEDKAQAHPFSLLKTQYRMTNEIGGVVSRLSYGDSLRHGRGLSGPRIEFIDIDGEWQTTHYSVAEDSYFHLAAVPILHALSPDLGQDDILFLSPFRSQRSLLAALAFDLRGKSVRQTMYASTIHRAQGSEAKAVVVDLTTHSPQRLSAFFKEKGCENLFNVAISRARDRLFILGSSTMLKELSKTMPFWGRVVGELSREMECLPCDEIIDILGHFESISSIPLTGAKELPAIYSHRASIGASGPGIDALMRTAASRKLLVFEEGPGVESAGSCIIRTTPNSPALFVGGGSICLPHRGKWLAVKSPNVSRVLWRIGFAHLADEEVDPAQARRFFCPECVDGDLLLKQVGREGWFLVCTNTQGHTCFYRRRLSLEDAKLKTRLGNMTCPKKHPLTVRQGGTGLFLGCENYPACEYTESLAILRGA